MEQRRHHLEFRERDRHAIEQNGDVKACFGLDRIEFGELAIDEVACEDRFAEAFQRFGSSQDLVQVGTHDRAVRDGLSIFGAHHTTHHRVVHSVEREILEAHRMLLHERLTHFVLKLFVLHDAGAVMAPVLRACVILAGFRDALHLLHQRLDFGAFALPHRDQAEAEGRLSCGEIGAAFTALLVEFGRDLDDSRVREKFFEFVADCGRDGARNTGARLNDFFGDRTNLRGIVELAESLHDFLIRLVFEFREIESAKAFDHVLALGADFAREPGGFFFLRTLELALAERREGLLAERLLTIDEPFSDTRFVPVTLANRDVFFGSGDRGGAGLLVFEIETRRAFLHHLRKRRRHFERRKLQNEWGSDQGTGGFGGRCGRESEREDAERNQTENRGAHRLRVREILRHEAHLSEMNGRNPFLSFIMQ